MMTPEEDPDAVAFMVAKRQARFRANPGTIPHTGRNELCPCRSGLKFKHCCSRIPGEAADRKRERRRAALQRQLDTAFDQARIEYDRARPMSDELIERAVKVGYSRRELELARSKGGRIAESGRLVFPPVRVDSLAEALR